MVHHAPRRAAGWHLLAGRNEARTDSDKWRLHFEQLETAIAKERDESNKKQDGLEAQIKEMQVYCQRSNACDHVHLHLC